MGASRFRRGVCDVKSMSSFVWELVKKLCISIRADHVFAGNNYTNFGVAAAA
jgi:hypothetical protein